MPNTINQYRLQSGHHNDWLQTNGSGQKAPSRQHEKLLRNLSHISLEAGLARESAFTPPALNCKSLAGGFVAGLLVGCAIGSVATIAARQQHYAAPFNFPDSMATSMRGEGNFTLENANSSVACPKPDAIVATQQVMGSDNIPAMKYCSPSRTNCQWQGFDPFAQLGSTVQESLNAAGAPTLNNGLTYCDYQLASGDQIRMSLPPASSTAP